MSGLTLVDRELGIWSVDCAGLEECSATLGCNGSSEEEAKTDAIQKGWSHATGLWICWACRTARAKDEHAQR